MTIGLSDLLTPSDRDEMVADLLAIAALLDAPTTSWQEGDPTLTELMTVGQKLADLSLVAIDITKGGFGDLLPSDDWADIWAESRFKVVRVPATEAVGTISFVNASITQYDRAAGEIIVAHATTGKTYRNSAAVSVLASTTTDVAIVADETGTASNAAPGAITTMVSSLVGVTCTNAESVLGTDKETTPHLVTRARAKLGAFSPNGPKDAYNYVATTPELSATSVPITRTRTVTDEDTGDISVFLATAAGAPISGDVDIVQAAIDASAEPWGATATAIAATEHVIAVTYQVWVQGSQLTSAQIETAIADTLALWFSTLDLGGYVIPPDTGAVYVQALQQVIGRATPGILQVAVTVPSSDVVLPPDEVAVLGTVTPTITLL